jgi:hypothetical protein
VAPVVIFGKNEVEISVHLVVPGVGTRDYHLAQGATLGDLSRLSDSETANQSVFFEDLPFEEAAPLRNSASAWRASVPALRDGELAREYSEVIRTRRQPNRDAELRGDHS